MLFQTSNRGADAESYSGGSGTAAADGGTSRSSSRQEVQLLIKERRQLQLTQELDRRALEKMHAEQMAKYEKRCAAAAARIASIASIAAPLPLIPPSSHVSSQMQFQPPDGASCIYPIPAHPPAPGIAPNQRVPGFRPQMVQSLMSPDRRPGAPTEAPAAATTDPTISATSTPVQLATTESERDGIRTVIY